VSDSDGPFSPEAEPQSEEPQFEERSIAQVGTTHRHSNTLVVVFGVAILGLLLWFVNRQDPQVDDASLTDPEPVHFEAQTRRDPPRLPAPDPVVRSTDTRPAVTAPDPIQMEMARIAIRRAEEEAQLAEQRRRAPILVVDKRRDRGLGGVLSDVAGTTKTESSIRSLSDELAGGSVDTVAASYIANQETTIPQGTLIRGVLETAIQSDLPGFVRAEVAHDVYSFDGSRLLIPKASRLVGHYRSGLVRGQTRVFIVWDRLLRADGASVLIGSPGTDLLGRTGLAGDFDTHFFKIFGSSVLLSLVNGAIAIGVESVRDTSNSGTTILQNTNSLNRAAEIALENSINIPPTIHVDQGTPIQVFVARDLDFRQVSPR